MLVYRITALQYAADLSGEGARLYGGRWNPPGLPVLYTAESVALAVLETLANVPPDFLDANLFSRVIIALPDDAKISTIPISELPSNWSTYPAPVELSGIGREWLAKGKSLGLRVPSVVAGGEGWNLLLNPKHPDFMLVKVAGIAPFHFDTRLF